MLHAILKSTSIDRFEAELLLAHVLGKSREFIVAHPETKIPLLKHWYFLYLVGQRKKNVPIAYLTGHKEFFGLDFLVNKHTLVPRPETEVLVEMVVAELQNIYSNKKSTSGNNTLLVDVGTGSGCIPIGILHATQSNLMEMETVAIDVSKQALRVAHKNASTHNMLITFLQGSLLEPLYKQKNLRDYDHIIITANLPYLKEEEWRSEPSIHHEPKSALVADQDGLDLYYELLEQIKSQFQTGKTMSLYMEINPEQVEPLTKKVQALLPAAKIEIKKDHAERGRVVKLSLRAHDESGPGESNS